MPENEVAKVIVDTAYQNHARLGPGLTIPIGLGGSLALPFGCGRRPPQLSVLLMVQLGASS